MTYLLLRLKRFCGYAVGIVFFISGILKLMDPVGAGLVMKEYFQFLHISSLDIVAKPMGLVFAGAESVIGCALITGVWRKLIARIALGFQVFFSILTLLLVIYKPEMDCGCFGEAIHLNHNETFIKNIILLALLLIYYIPEKHLGETPKKKHASFGIVCISTAAFAIYSVLYIPMADFTSFKPGTVINNYSEIQTDMYEASFVYEKNGTEAIFTLDNLPDSSWTFIRTQTTKAQVNESEHSNISIFDKDGNYADSLLTKGKILAISIYDQNITETEIQKVCDLAEQAKNAGYTPLILTASADIDSPDQYFCDYKTLITLNRSSGGATYIDNGLIIRKWSKRTLPTPEELATISDEDSTETFIGRDTRSGLAFQGFLLYVFAVMLLL